MLTPEAETMREYVEKVSATMGDNGDNTKSPVAGKNDMGGDAPNLVAGGEADTQRYSRWTSKQFYKRRECRKRKRTRR